MRFRTLVAAALVTAAAPAFGQSLLTKPTPQHASVRTSASAATVAPGGKVTLWADVAPFPAIHIYAAGAKDFTPVSLMVTPPNAAVKPGKALYPKPDAASPADAAPAYRQEFRIAVPVTVAATAAKGPVTIAGTVNYQACDDRLCYPVASAPVNWKVEVR